MVKIRGQNSDGKTVSEKKIARCERFWRQWCHLAIIQSHVRDLWNVSDQPVSARSDLFRKLLHPVEKFKTIPETWFFDAWHQWRSTGNAVVTQDFWSDFRASVWPGSWSNFRLGLSPSSSIWKSRLDQRLWFWSVVFLQGQLHVKKDYTARRAARLLLSLKDIAQCSTQHVNCFFKSKLQGCSHSIWWSAIIDSLRITPWAYLAALRTNPPECSHTVWSRNGREGCSGMLYDVITQMVYQSQMKMCSFTEAVNKKHRKKGLHAPLKKIDRKVTSPFALLVQWKPSPE